MQIKGVPFSKLQGSHDPEDRSHYDQASIAARRHLRESLHAAPADPGVMVIPSGTRQVPSISFSGPSAGNRLHDTDAAEVLRLDEDPAGSARSSLPSRPGSRAGLNEATDPDASDAARASLPRRPSSRAGPQEAANEDARIGRVPLPSRPGSRAGRDEVSLHDATNARNSLQSRPGSGAGLHETSHKDANIASLSLPSRPGSSADYNNRSDQLSGSVPTIASVVESESFSILPAEFSNVSASRPGLSKTLHPGTGLAADEYDGLVTNDIHRPVDRPGPGIMSMSTESDLDSPTGHPMTRPGSAEFSFRQSGTSAPDALNEAELAGEIGASHQTRVIDLMDSREYPAVQGDVLAGFRRSFPGEPGSSSNSPFQPGEDSSALSEPYDRINSSSSSRDLRSRLGLARQSDPDGGELRLAHSAIDSRIPSGSQAGSGLSNGLTAAAAEAMQTLDIRDRPGTSAGSTFSSNGGSLVNDLDRSSTTAGGDALHASLLRSPSSSGNGRLDLERRRRASQDTAAPAWRPQFGFAPGSRSDLPRPGTAALAGEFSTPASPGCWAPAKDISALSACIGQAVLAWTVKEHEGLLLLLE